MIQEDHTWTLTGVEIWSTINAKWDVERRLRRCIEEELRTNPQVSLIIEADEGLEHGVVVELMDIARGGDWFSQIGATQK